MYTGQGSPSHSGILAFRFKRQVRLVVYNRLHRLVQMIIVQHGQLQVRSGCFRRQTNTLLESFRRSPVCVLLPQFYTFDIERILIAYGSCRIARQIDQRHGTNECAGRHACERPRAHPMAPSARRQSTTPD
ncbi:MAG: hypothetical protein K9N51_08875 [Candidatus Pacebacteria bacterium]|nr:hypothetical protein [Candidatus Paceibacterota bacterium]